MMAGSASAVESTSASASVDAAPAAHAHHAGGSSPAQEPAPSGHGSHPGPGDCALMTACAAAAPAVASEVPPDCDEAEATGPTERDALVSSSLAFEPPPPRQHLI